jgi:uncharacterized protein
MSSATYPGAFPVRAIVERLRNASQTPLHEFWPDDLSLLDSASFDATRIHGPKQITDLYLLALAVRHGGRLVTFDRLISLNSVTGAQERHLVRL